MKRLTQEKTTPETALEALLEVADDLGYEVVWVVGDNGGLFYWAHKIEVGKDHSLEDRVIVLSHEIGHAKDYADNPPDAQEVIMMTCFPTEWEVGKQYYKRERRAWNYAALLLKDLELWDLMKYFFGAYKKNALSAYYKQHIRAKEEGRDKPEQALFDEVYNELTDTSREG